MCACMLYVRMDQCRPENHLRCCSSGNFYLGFSNWLSHWLSLEEQARLGWACELELCLSRLPSAAKSVSLGLLGFVWNLSSQTQVLILSKQHFTD